MGNEDNPEFKGPLNNPEWSLEDNIRYENLDHGTGESSQSARRILGLEETQGTDIPEQPEQKSVVVPVKTTKSPRPRSRRPATGIKADIADNDKKVEATYGKPGEYI